jgi:alkanesulfonate monooxygenase SsuD/methylene tetrahydromethanopterin reductase-like flavin-dependent oxidoreductase (luciferase family)
MFDGPVTLTMMAADTRRIRVGTLATSLYFRPPVTFAKAAVTVDHLSSGRAELALGWVARRQAPRPAAWPGRPVNGSSGLVGSWSWSGCFSARR